MILNVLAERYRRWRDPHASEGEMMALLDRELEPWRAGAVETHLSRCSACRRELAHLRTARAVALSRRPSLPAVLLEQTAHSVQTRLRERPHSLPSEAAIRTVLGEELSVRARLSPDHVRAAIDTMLGVPHPSAPFRMMPQFVWFSASLFGLVAVGAWLYWLALGGWSDAGIGDFRTIEAVFGVPYKLFLILMAAAGTVLSFAATTQFPVKHPLHAAWLVCSVAAGCRLLGGTVVAAPAVFLGQAWPQVEGAGLFIAGPVSLVALGIGLLHVHRAYRTVGLSAKLTWADSAMLLAGAAFTLRHMIQVAEILWNGPAQTPLGMLLWLSDPALLFTLSVAVPLRRMAIAQGGGLVAGCWSSMAAGVLFTFLGNFLLFLETSQIVPWPWTSVNWLVWIPATTAFTLGPAYQFAADAVLTVRSRAASSSAS